MSPKPLTTFSPIPGTRLSRMIDVTRDIDASCSLTQPQRAHRALQEHLRLTMRMAPRRKSGRGTDIDDSSELFDVYITNFG